MLSSPWYFLAAVVVSGSGLLVLGLIHGLVHSLVHSQVMVVISKALLGKAVLPSSPSGNRSNGLLLDDLMAHWHSLLD